MQYKGIIVTFFALMLGAAAFAGERHRMQIELAVDGDESQAFRFDSADAGFERVYIWMSDFARPETVAEFGDTVIARLA